MTDKYDVAVIGAGPAGMMAAISAASNSRSIALIDKNPQIGRKLFSTGNGRCNLTNANCSIDRYHGSTPDFIRSVIEQFDASATMSFFESIGLMLKQEDGGRIFPRTNQAASVVHLLNIILNEMGVSVMLNTPIKGITKDGHWQLLIGDTALIDADALILATGGRAAHHLGSTGDGLYWAERMGHSLTPIFPALVPIVTEEGWTKDAQGVKVDVLVDARCGRQVITSGCGDLIFTNYGVSGPAVMALSGRIAPYIGKAPVELYIDLFPDVHIEGLMEHIRYTITNHPSMQVADILTGMIPDKLIQIAFMLSGIDGNLLADDLRDGKWFHLLRTLKALRLTVSKLRPFKEAQVTSGGVDCQQVNPWSLESKIVDRLFFAGEILDVDGDSGGFNLQWAWSSGFVAGAHI